MKKYTYTMAENREVYVEVVVEADSQEEADNLALSGETVSEIELYVNRVLGREFVKHHS